jgi:hypothetical protein
MEPPKDPEHGTKRMAARFDLVLHFDHQPPDWMALKRHLRECADGPMEYATRGPFTWNLNLRYAVRIGAQTCGNAPEAEAGQGFESRKQDRQVVLRENSPMPLSSSTARESPLLAGSGSRPPSRLAVDASQNPTKDGSRLIHFAAECGS